jgi:NADP-dependent 3-hydroxy acid dehydrogenase YdfG
MSRSPDDRDSGAILKIHSGAGPRFGANLRVLITGAGAGIGLACARAFAEQGAELILSDIDAAALKRVATRFGATGRFCDVASEASVAIFSADILRSYDSLDVLINAAGKSYVRNLGTMRITRAFLPMMKSDGGKKDIVNIAPMGGPVRDACPFPYAASQEAFERLSEALAENVRGTKVALTTIIPRVRPSAAEDAGTPITALANLSELGDFDPDRVAAEVVAAVRSHRTRPGRVTLLTAKPTSEGGRRSIATKRDPRLRRSG